MPSDDTQPPLVIGIDGGGTKTVAWLARGGGGDCAVLGRGFGGPSNQRAVGPVAAMMGIETAVAAAFVDAGIERQTVAAACLGLAGADRDSDRGVVERWADEARLAERVRVVNDALPLLFVEGLDGCGVALIAGTGSLALGRSADGRTVRSGGWGWMFGDEGSAFAIGHDVLQAVTRAVDGRGEATALAELVLEHLKIASSAEIVTAVYGHEIPRSVIAGLAPLAFDAARRDVVAELLLGRAAEQLAEMVASVARRLELPGGFSLAMTGAVLIGQHSYRLQVLRRLERLGVVAGRSVVVTDAVEGALRMARRMV